MAIQTLNNGEAGVVVRGKINSNFSEHAGSLAAISEAVSAANLRWNAVMRASVRSQSQGLTIPSAPTITVGVANAATVISGGVDVAFNDARLTPTVPLAQVSAFWPDTLMAKPVYLDNAAPNSAANMAGVFGGYTFSTHATAFEVFCKGYSIHRVWVLDESDVPYALAEQTMASTSSTYRVLYDFGGSRKYRRFFVQFTSSVGGVTIGPADTVTPWSPNTPRIIVVGDSFTEGSGATALSGFAQRLGERLGCFASVMAVGLGGTGYVATSSGTKKCALDIVQSSVIPWITRGAIVVWCHGLNDSADVSTNAAACFDAVTAASPLTPQVVFMPFQPRSITGIANARTQLQAVCASRSWLYAIDNTTYGTRPEITGTGRVGATTGVGNSDWVTGTDGTHPSSAGHDHIGAYRAARILAAASS